MNIQELYSEIEGNYEQALHVLRMEKLIDKHICKLPANELFAALAEAGKNRDEVALFEKSHAIKGVCGNLGLTKLAGLASAIAEEFRPGNPRKLSDEEVRQTLAQTDALYQKTVDGIRRYEQLRS